MPSPGSKKRPLLLGHRGARAVRSIPENSIESFERALADGCDGFEFDVRLTTDGEAVICHDPHYRRIEVAAAPGADLAGLARLEQVLAMFGDRAFLDIELKVAGLETITLELLCKHPPRCGHVVSSFLAPVLQSLHVQDSAVPLGVICETRKELSGWRDVPVQYVIPHFSLIDAQLAAQLKSAGKKIVAWTVNDAQEMLRLRDLGVNVVISDDARLLSETLSGRDR